MPWVDPYATLLEDSLATNVNPDDPAEINSSNYRARAIDIVGVPPQVFTRAIAVDSVVADPFGTGGGDFTVSWTVKAGGNATATGVSDPVPLAGIGIDCGRARVCHMVLSALGEQSL